MPEEKKIRTAQLGTVGKIGEDFAAEFVEHNGFRIVNRNLKFGRNEIDIIYIDGINVVFCEVKTRSVKKYAGNSRFATPSGSVTLTKQKKLICAARQYLKEHRSSLYPRFDVIEVWVKKDENGKYVLDNINLIKHAFTA